METDKELLRAGRYAEALGDNYEHYCYHILLFKNNLCVEGNEFKHKEINKKYSSRSEAERCVRIMTKRNKLPCHMDYRIWNSNSDWQ